VEPSDLANIAWLNVWRRLDNRPLIPRDDVDIKDDRALDDWFKSYIRTTVMHEAFNRLPGDAFPETIRQLQHQAADRDRLVFAELLRRHKRGEPWDDVDEIARALGEDAAAIQSLIALVDRSLGNGLAGQREIFLEPRDWQAVRDENALPGVVDAEVVKRWVDEEFSSPTNEVAHAYFSSHMAPGPLRGEKTVDHDALWDLLEDRWTCAHGKTPARECLQCRGSVHTIVSRVKRKMRKAPWYKEILRLR
jgi:hypothetical protein